MPAQCKVDLSQGTTMNPSLAAGYTLRSGCRVQCKSGSCQGLHVRSVGIGRLPPNMINSRAGVYPRCGLLWRKDPCLPESLSVASGMITRDWMMSPNVNEWKLVDVPELGYFTTDKPFPRGELLLKTKSMISGYHKHQDVRLLASNSARMLPKLPSKVNLG